MNGIRVISFDLDETLWPLGSVVADAEQAVFQWLCVHHPQVAARFGPEELQALKMEIAASQPSLRHDYSALRRETLHQAALRAGGDPALVEPAFQIFLAARNRVSPHQDVRPALERLSRNYRLVTLSNGNADPRRVGFGHYFELCLTPPLAGCAKPEPGIFRYLCEFLDVVPHQVLHVGDDPECDIEGAAACGLRTAWMNRAGMVWPGAAQPDLEVPDLMVLADRLVPNDSRRAGQDL